MTRSRTGWWIAAALGPVALLVGELGFALNDFGPGETLFLDIAVGSVSIVVGLILWWRFPDNRTGLLLYLVGVLWAIAGVHAFDDPVLFGVGQALQGAQDAVLAHLLLAYPGGRLVTRPSRVVVAMAYATFGISALTTLFYGAEACGCNLRTNALLIGDWPGLVRVLDALGLALGVMTIAGAVVILVHRWIVSGPLGRRIFTPVLASAVALAVVLMAESIVVATLGDIPESLVPISAAMRLLIPLALLWGLMQTTIDRAAVGGLVVDLERMEPDVSIEEVLAVYLHDPSLRLAFWVDDQGVFVDGAGYRVAEQQESQTRVFTMIESDGDRLAALIHDPALLRDPVTIEAAISATRMVIQRESLQAQVRAQLEEVRASRARIVEATEEERRRIERDLHDGAQQRLLALCLQIRLIGEQTDDPGIAAALREAEEDARAALVELRDLAQGIYPAILASEGLAPAVELIAERSPIPVEVSADRSRQPSNVEAAAYFVIAEAVTNAIKHSQASSCHVRTRMSGGLLRVEISDDGIGGARFESGTGLRGIADRVAACNGSLAIESIPHAGTTIRIELPVGGA